MIFSPRWMKLFRDLKSTKGRMIMMVFAIAIGIFGVGAILDAYTILTREMKRNYMGTNPATASFELEKVDDNLVSAVRKYPGIADAEAGLIILSRLEVKPNEWMPILLFVVKDFNTMRINTFQSEAGAWPPPDGTLLLEKAALPLVNAKIGDTLTIQAPSSPKHNLSLSGIVHDPGLAPAWQEQMAYGYITPATMAILKGDNTLQILKIIVKDDSYGRQSTDTTISGLVEWLKQQGFQVSEIRIPPASMHPHQSQMNAIMVMLLIFSLMTLLLGGILTATLIAGLLAQQIRPIGIMKTIGARSPQIARLYLVLIVVIGIIAVLLGIPPSILVGVNLSRVVADLLNLKLYSLTIPSWVFVVQILAGILIPCGIALIPIFNATKATIREAISDYGINREVFKSNMFDKYLSSLEWLDRTLIMSIRNTFRRRKRLILILTLLGTAGGMFIASINARTAWEKNLVDAAADRHYDLEIRLNQAESQEKIQTLISQVPGVQHVESWSMAPAAVSRSDGLNVVRTYPDGGHGSLNLRSVPPDSNLIQLTLLEGRWLQVGDNDAVVLNHMAKAFYPNAKPGDLINFTVNNRSVTLRLVGIVREILTPATAYVYQDDFEQVMGQSGRINAMRIVMTQHDTLQRSIVSGEIERVLEKENISVKVSILETRLEAGVSGHVYLFIFILMMMAILMAVVGELGLMSSMGISVVERTREFGIMRTIGGKSRTVIRNIISEGVFIGLMSWGIAVLFSLPLSALVGDLLGNLSYRLSLPLVLSPLAMFIWFVIVIVGSVVASAYPAWKASQMTIRETLAYI